MYAMQCKRKLKWVQGNADLPSFGFVLNINVLPNTFISFRSYLYLSSRNISILVYNPEAFSTRPVQTCMQIT